jgi:hypothetical protein
MNCINGLVGKTSCHSRMLGQELRRNRKLGQELHCIRNRRHQGYQV